jgi:Cof subfamily protein (haloacid dehalogenase superfamily)
MGAVRLVATDLDGTLLLDGLPLRVSDRVRAALAAVQEVGITVVLVTARNWRTVGEIATLAGLGGSEGALAICSNGAVVVELPSMAIHRSHAAPIAVVRSFVARCRSSWDDVCFGWETAEGVYRDERYHADAMASPSAAGYAENYLGAIELTADIADDHEVTKLLVRHPGVASDALLARLQPLAGADVTLTISGGEFVEVTAAGVTKAFALSLLCADLGIDASEVVAVGDQPNDLPMLEWAGRGVAMGNAHPAVLDVVAEHTASNADDGLALVLESVLP